MEISECLVPPLFLVAMVVGTVALTAAPSLIYSTALKLRRSLRHWKPKNPFLPAGAFLGILLVLSQIAPQEMPTITIVPCRCHESSTATSDELSCVLRPGRLSELQSLPVIRVGAPSADFFICKHVVEINMFSRYDARTLQHQL